MTPPARELPGWPLGLLLAGYPIWWALGLAPVAVVVAALVMVGFLALRGQTFVPPAGALWGAFLLIALASSVELDSALRAAGFLVRYAGYLGAGAVFLYVRNAARSLTLRTVTTWAVCLFAAAVIGGWLGLFFPYGSVPTVTSHLVPGSIAGNDLVHAIVHPGFAEVQQDYGQAHAIARPSAPFPYTNSWGCNVAILVPFLVLGIVETGSWRRRIGLGVLLALAAVPAAATLNRGMALAVAAGLLWAAGRYLIRGHRAAAIGLVAVFVAALAVAFLSGTLSALSDRLRFSHTNAGRAAIYREAWTGALHSPLLGHGAPRPSSVTDVSIGTQGAIWTVMYSYGLLALVAYVGFLVWAFVRAGRQPGHAGVWLQVILLSVLLCSVVYDFDGPELSLAMVAAGLAFRPVRGDELTGPGARPPDRSLRVPPSPSEEGPVPAPSAGQQIVDQSAG